MTLYSIPSYINTYINTPITPITKTVQSCGIASMPLTTIQTSYLTSILHNYYCSPIYLTISSISEDDIENEFDYFHCDCKKAISQHLVAVLIDMIMRNVVFVVPNYVKDLNSFIEWVNTEPEQILRECLKNS